MYSEEPLDFEYILFNHLKVFSESFAQKICDYDGMVSMYEQYSMTQMSRTERDTLRIYKRFMHKVKQIILDYHEKIIQEYDDYDEEKASLLNNKDQDLEVYDVIYYNYLLRWLVSCTRKTYRHQIDVYLHSEFFEDLKIELESNFEMIDRTLLDIIEKEVEAEIEKERKDEDELEVDVRG